MDVQDWWNVLLGVAGTVIAGRGIHVLLTHRAPTFMRTRWNRPVDAGMYLLCGGLCLVLLAAGYLGRLAGLLGAATAWILMALAFASLALGLLKYWPRGGKNGGSRPPTGPRAPDLAAVPSLGPLMHAHAQAATG